MIHRLMTPKYFPYTLKLLHFLNALWEKVYLPLYNVILDQFQHFKTGKKSTLKPVVMETILKYPKEYMGTVPCSKQTYGALFQLLYSVLKREAQNPGFPDISLPLLVQVPLST